MSAYLDSIHHDGSVRYVRLPGGRSELHLGDVVTVRLRSALDAPLQRVLLRTCPDGEQQFVEMLPQDPAPGAACRWWEAALQLTMPVCHYRFLLFTADGPWWYNGSGLRRHTPTDGDDFRLLAGYQAPAWVRDSIFYQIYPDRFANGDPNNDVRDGEFEYRGFRSTASRWGQAPADGRAALLEFYGGDLTGIQQRLDYLQDLGVDALYLNPIFTAYSNHRYDVVDYEQVDPHLGGEQALISLRQALSGRGMRLVLDIVPNHCGFLHPWFQAAQADCHAPTAEYFTFFNHPGEYASWLGVATLPKLNYRSAKLRQAMYGSPQAIFRRWLQPPYSADGWRLDVANMLARQGADQLGLEIGRGIRQAVKEVNPQAYLVGENFFDACWQLQGDLWDAVMNYAGFSIPLWHWLKRFEVHQHAQPKHAASEVPYSTRALADTWQAYRAAIPWSIACQQFNQLGSHDTERIFSVVGGNEALNRLAAGILLTYVGVPCVYYGDEVGLGRGKNETRACMPWDQAAWDMDLREFYQALVALRRGSAALLQGGFQVLLAEAETLAYLRDVDEEQVIVVAHRGPTPRPAAPLDVIQAAIPDGTILRAVFGSQTLRVEGGRLALPAMPQGIEIWRTQ